MDNTKTFLIRSRASTLAAFVVTGVAVFPAVAFALPGYTNLINGFCQAQGSSRVQYTDDGCTLCHHPGTFTSDPAHRVEPTWSKFELGRASGSYSFFCPGPSDTPNISTTPTVPASMPVPDTAIGGPISHTEMPWMSLGYPAGHAKTEVVSVDAQPDSPTPAAAGTQSAVSAPEAAAATVRSSAASEALKSQLEKLGKDLGISAAQQPAWTELQAAVLAARVTASNGVPESRADVSLSDRLAVGQREHASRIAQLRAVNTAAVRLNAGLNERQQRLLATRLPPLLGDL